MAKPELGTKRLCGGCGAKYYDLNRDPITCPKCGTVFIVAQAQRVQKAAKAAAVVEDDEDDETEDDSAEIVSLEEADAETEGDASDIDDEEDVEGDIGGDEDVFIDDEDEDEESVPGIVVRAGMTRTPTADTGSRFPERSCPQSGRLISGIRSGRDVEADYSA